MFVTCPIFGTHGQLFSVKHGVVFRRRHQKNICYYGVIYLVFIWKQKIRKKKIEARQISNFKIFYYYYHITSANVYKSVETYLLFFTNTGIRYFINSGSFDVIYQLLSGL